MASHEQVIDIHPQRGLLDADFRGTWEARELLGFLIWRDVKVRYRQTAIGLFWFALQPVLATLIFSVVFGRLAKLPSAGLPYPVFAYAALVPWHFFAQSVTRGVNSMTQERQLISKIYFPRLLLPLGVLMAGLVDFGVGFLVLGGMLVYYGIVPGLAVLLTPLVVLLMIATALAVVTWLAPLNVQYRDVSYTLPFLLQIWMFASPIAYSVELIPERWRWLYGLNPMAGVIECFRWAWLGTAAPSPSMLAMSVAGVLVMLAAGVIFFHRMERTFADTI